MKTFWQECVLPLVGGGLIAAVLLGIALTARSPAPNPHCSCGFQINGCQCEDCCNGGCAAQRK